MPALLLLLSENPLVWTGLKEQHSHMVFCTELRYCAHPERQRHRGERRLEIVLIWAAKISDRGTCDRGGNLSNFSVGKNVLSHGSR
jgi:hypothetical protein